MSAPSQKCAICLDIVRRNSRDLAIPTSCFHVFHRACIETWSTMSNTCPLCKVRFKALEMVGSRLKIKCEEVNLTVDEEPPTMISEDPCRICGSGDNAHLLLLCDGNHCDQPHHTYCVGLSEVPEGNWFCPKCWVEDEEKQNENETKSDDVYVPSSESESEASDDRQVGCRSLIRCGRTSRAQQMTTNQRVNEVDVMNVEFDEESCDSDFKDEQPSIIQTPRRRPRKRRRPKRWSPPQVTTYCRRIDKHSSTTPRSQMLNIDSVRSSQNPEVTGIDYLVLEPPNEDVKRDCETYDKISDPLKDRMLVSAPRQKKTRGKNLGFLLEDELMRSSKKRALQNLEYFFMF